MHAIHTETAGFDVVKPSTAPDPSSSVTTFVIICLASRHSSITITLLVHNATRLSAALVILCSASKIDICCECLQSNFSLINYGSVSRTVFHLSEHCL